jgi:WD40 repeat protein
VWDAASGEELHVLSGHGRPVASATFSPDGTRIVTASSDRTALVWDAASGEMLDVLSGHEGVVSSASFSPDGTRILTASRDNTARVWDAAPWRLDDPRLPEVEGEFATPEEEHKARFFEWKRQRYEEWVKAYTQTLETPTTEASVTQAGEGAH